MNARLEKILAPVAGADKAGRDTYGEGWRSIIDSAFMGEAASSAGFAGDGSKGPSVSEWASRAEELEQRLQETKDIWLAVYLARAGANARDLDAALLGVEALAGICELYWEEAHPRVSEFGVEDRVNACNELAKASNFLSPLLSSPAVRLPQAAVQTLQAFEDLRAKDDAGTRQSMRQSLAQAGSTEFLDPFSKLRQIEAALRRIEALFDNKAAEQGPSFRDLCRALSDLAGFADVLAGQAQQATGLLVVQQQSSTGVVISGHNGSARGGMINSREDVIQALDAIGGYYERVEPGSPIRMLLGRMKAWVNKDFLELMADIAPDKYSEMKVLMQGQAAAEPSES
jgi:type VI secretion system ImpA family protein